MSVKRKTRRFQPQRYDDCFRHQPSYAGILLNSSVYPNGVRTQTLEQLSQYNEAPCMLNFTKTVKPENKASNENQRLECFTGRSDHSQPDRYNLSHQCCGQTPRSSRLYSEDTAKSSWVTKEQKIKISDVRDHMYINTYYPAERPMRYNETKLPRISKNRPWSVSEGNPSKRVSVSNDNHREQRQRTRMKTFNGWMNSKNRNDELLPVFCDVKGVPMKSQCEAEYVESSANIAQYAYSKNQNRPLRSEQGRYRPFSTVSVQRTPRISVDMSCSPKRFISVNQYMKYVESKTLQEKAKISNTPKSGGSHQRLNTSVSQYHDPNVRALQFVTNVNRPPSSKETPSSGSDQSSRGTSSR